MHEIKNLEVFTESVPQLSLNLWIIKQYGVTDPIQVISAILSYVSLYKTLAERVSFIINGKDLGIFSMTFLKSIANLSVMFFSLLIILLFVMSEDAIPPWYLLPISLGSHSGLAWIIHPKKICFKLPKLIAENGKNRLTFYTNVGLILVYCILYAVSNSQELDMFLSSLKLITLFYRQY